MNTARQHDGGERLVARVLRDVLAGARFETMGDVKDALRQRCRRLGIRCPVDVMDRALDLVGSNHPLVTTVKPRPADQPAPPVPPPISRSEAGLLYHRLIRRYQQEHAVPVVSSGAPPYFPDLVRVPA